MLLHVVKKNQCEEKRRGKGRYKELRHRDYEDGTEGVLERDRERDREREVDLDLKEG